MNCKECNIELITDSGELNEFPRYGGLCADCFDDLEGWDFEYQMDMLLSEGELSA